MKDKSQVAFNEFLASMLKKDDGIKVPNGWYVVNPSMLKEAFDAGQVTATQAMYDNLIGGFQITKPPNPEIKKPKIKRKSKPKNKPKRKAKKK